MAHRFGGLVALLAGVMLGYLGMWMPLEDAAAHKDSITMSVKAAIFAPPLIVFGLIYLVLGGVRAKEVLGEREAWTPLFWIVAVVSGLAGLVLYYWIDQGLAAAGYK